ncbi:hypothetical protein [Infirmifilum uzonense]|uniref:hypothetical protein n=1 Tax=Infirmifilum uzonense TaxID=1550241 RepID=UPI000AFE276B|nr:hypothetical protein [Infirmifilum uzonense]
MPVLTPSLVYAAYRRALRFGVFWGLRPEERKAPDLYRFIREVFRPLVEGVR